MLSRPLLARPGAASSLADPTLAVMPGIERKGWREGGRDVVKHTLKSDVGVAPFVGFFAHGLCRRRKQQHICHE